MLLIKENGVPAKGGIQGKAGTPNSEAENVLVKGAMAAFLDIWGTQLRTTATELNFVTVMGKKCQRVFEK